MFITVFTSIWVNNPTYLETSSFAQKERILSQWMALEYTCIIIYEVLKSTQVNMIFSYKNYINKRYLKP